MVERNDGTADCHLEIWILYPAEEYKLTTLSTNTLDLSKINLMRHLSLLIFSCLALEINGFIIPAYCWDFCLFVCFYIYIEVHTQHI